MKIKVNKEIAEKLELARKHVMTRDNYAHMVYYFLSFAIEGHSLTTQQWLDEKKITVADVENAFKYGWEVEYEFQVGDLVSINDGEVFVIGEEWADWRVSIEKVKAHKKFYTLVCKAKNREDFKSVATNETL